MLETGIQLFINGISLGCAYALITLGFVLVINAIGAVNFAQGDLVMAGGFLSVVFAFKGRLYCCQRCHKNDT